MGSTIRRISDGRHSESHAEQRLPVVLRQQASRRFIEVRMGINKAWNDRLTLKIYHVHVNRDSYTITGSDLLNASIHNHDCARINHLISPCGHYGGSCECDIMMSDATPGHIELNIT